MDRDVKEEVLGIIRAAFAANGGRRLLLDHYRAVPQTLAFLQGWVCGVLLVRRQSRHSANSIPTTKRPVDIAPMEIREINDLVRSTLETEPSTDNHS